MNMQAFLDLLEEVRCYGDRWTAVCPAHNDPDFCLILLESDGRIMPYCTAGCTVAQIVEALGLTHDDLYPDDDSDGEEDAQLERPVMPLNSGATVQPSAEMPVNGGTSGLQSGAPPVEGRATGLTIARYAALAQLSIDALRRWGLHDVSHQRRPAVAIPYFDEGGQEVAVRLETALEGSDSLRWKRGAAQCPYGLPYLQQARNAGYVVLVKGETECQTLWAHDVPALGIPDRSMWQPAWTRYFDGIQKIFVVVESGTGGDALLSWVRRSAIRDRVFVVRLDEGRTVSDLYRSGPKRFWECFQAVLDSATPWSDADAETQDAWGRCEALAKEPRILDRFAEMFATRVAGEERAGKLLYLIVTTRFLDRPVSAAIKGVSAAGKSHLVASVLSFFPESAYYGLTAMSERALAYSAEPLSHRFLVLYEAAGSRGDFASYLIRSLLSEGRVRYETVEKTDTGMRPHLLEREGPTGLLVTTTAIALHEENETRFFSIPVTDTPEQTPAVLQRMARDDVHSSLDFSPWHALQVWLEAAEHRVSIPFAETLATLIPPVSVRLRRDFRAILSLIRAHAILHQANRTRDAAGRIVATLDDYVTIRELVADLISEGAEVAVPAAIRETVEAVRAVLTERSAENAWGTGVMSGHVTAVAVAQMLHVDKSTASRRLRAAAKLGYLKNAQVHRYLPGEWQLGELLPEEGTILPSREAVVQGVLAAERNTGEGHDRAGNAPALGHPLTEAAAPSAPSSRESRSPERKNVQSGAAANVSRRAAPAQEAAARTLDEIFDSLDRPKGEVADDLWW